MEDGDDSMSTLKFRTAASTWARDPTSLMKVAPLWIPLDATPLPQVSTFLYSHAAPALTHRSHAGFSSSHLRLSCLHRKHPFLDFFMALDVSGNVQRGISAVVSVSSLSSGMYLFMHCLNFALLANSHFSLFYIAQLKFFFLKNIQVKFKIFRPAALEFDLYSRLAQQTGLLPCESNSFSDHKQIPNTTSPTDKHRHGSGKCGNGGYCQEQWSEKSSPGAPTPKVVMVAVMELCIGMHRRGC